MGNKSEFEVYTDANKESEVFSFSEANNEKQFLNENYVFGDEENASQTSADLNTSSYGSEENVSEESSYEENNDDSDRKEENNQDTSSNSSQTSSTSSTSTSANSSTASASSSAASTASTAAASSSSVLATVATTATVAVVAVVGGGTIMNEAFKEPTICQFQEVLVEENNVHFMLKLGTDEEKIDSGEETDDTNCVVELSYNSSNRFCDEKEVKSFGIFSSEFTNLDYDTEYCLNVYRPMLLGAERDYLLEEGYVFKTKKKDEEFIAVESITLSQSEASLSVGDELELTATILPGNATNKTISWKSDNNDIATVSDGVVHAISAGTATITAYQGDIFATCAITVSGDVIHVTGVSFEKPRYNLNEGETVTLEPIIAPENATNKGVTYFSDNTLTAMVDNDGVVTASEPGQATITVTTDDGSFTAKCVIVVKERVVPAESLSLSTRELSMELGETVELVATILPEGFTDEVGWISSKPDDVYVTASENDPTIGLITAYSVEEVTITVYVGDHYDYCTVSVSEPDVPVESIYFEEDEFEVETGQIIYVPATILPEGFTDEVTWSSDNKNAATANPSIEDPAIGEIATFGVGKAVITVKAGNYSAECYINVVAKKIPTESITLNYEELELDMDGYGTLIYTVEPAMTTDEPEWTMDKEGVVEFVQIRSDECKVHAIGSGTVTVTVTSGDFSADCVITVNEVTVPVESIEFKQTALEMQAGDQTSIEYTISPENATNQDVTWSSDNNDVAEVDDTGKVIAIGEGRATITATTVDGDFKDTCTVTVSPKQTVPLEGIHFEEESYSILYEESIDLKLVFEPEDATNKIVEYSSSDSNIVDVDTNGTITGVGVGEATIFAVSDDGGYEASCNVIVNRSQMVPVESVSLNKVGLEMEVGDTETLVATVLPENAEDKSVIWESSNNDVVTVDISGIVTAVGIGNATIKVTTVDGNYTDTCSVVVSEHTDVSPTGIELDHENLELEVGVSETIIATIYPADATNKNVTWTSSDDSVATVEDGLVTAVGSGEAIITATTEDGGYETTCTVTVSGSQSTEPAVTSLIMNEYVSNVGNIFGILDFEFEDPSGVWGNEFMVQINTSDGETTFTSELASASHYMECFNTGYSYYMPDLADGDVSIIVNTDCTIKISKITDSDFSNPIYEGTLPCNRENYTYASPTYSYQQSVTSGGYNATITLGGDFYSVYSDIRVVLQDVDSGVQYTVNISSDQLNTAVETDAPVSNSQKYLVTVYGTKSGGTVEALIFNETVSDFGL